MIRCKPRPAAQVGQVDDLRQLWAAKLSFLGEMNLSQPPGGRYHFWFQTK